MNVEVSFGGPKVVSNDLEDACDNLLEVLLLIALNLEVSYVLLLLLLLLLHILG